MGYPACSVFTRALQALQELILFQSILKGTLDRAGDANAEISSSGTEHKGLC